MNKQKNKITLTSSQRSFMEVVASNANNKYYFFPQIFVKIEGTNEFEENSMEDLPEGIQKYIKSRME